MKKGNQSIKRREEFLFSFEVEKAEKDGETQQTTTAIAPIRGFLLIHTVVQVSYVCLLPQDWAWIIWK